MPTHDEDPQFIREYLALSLDRQRAFRRALRLMVEDMKNKRPFRPSLRVKGVQGHAGIHAGIYEMTWEMPNGRATFLFGAERIPGEPHIIWRRIGGHEILSNP